MARPSRTTSSGALHGGTTWMRLLAIIGQRPFALHSAADSADRGRVERSTGRSIGDELDRPEHTEAADLADARVT